MRQATCATCDGGPCLDHDRGRGCERYVFRINRRSNMECDGCEGRGWVFNEKRQKDHVCDECGGLGTEPVTQAEDALRVYANEPVGEVVGLSITGGSVGARRDMAALIHELLDVAGVSIGPRARSFDNNRDVARRLRDAATKVCIVIEPQPLPKQDEPKWKRP